MVTHILFQNGKHNTYRKRVSN